MNDLKWQYKGVAPGLAVAVEKQDKAEKCNACLKAKAKYVRIEG